MTDTDLFFSTRPAFPWSVYPLGLPALGVVTALLVLLTVWTYLGHPQATRRRILTVLALRLAALVLALLTAVRPSVGFQEEPKVPSYLLVGVDLSESMTVKDEVNNAARIDAARRVLDKAQGTLDELAAEQNVTVVVYGFGLPDFSPDVNRYDPKAPAEFKRSDYGTYLNRVFDKWQGERYLRGHLLVGDGGDNGVSFAAAAEAARWGKRNTPVHTFVAGKDDTTGDARDLAVTAVTCEPSPVPLKTDVTVTAKVNAYGFAGARPKVRAFFDDKEVAADDVTLSKERDNEVRFTVKAPATPGEVKVRVRVEPLPGEVSDLNNESETYLTVTKEGVRVLVIDRLRWENTLLLDALRAEKRFDVNVVWWQTGLPPTPEQVQFLDLENQAYDVILVGNVSVPEILAAEPRFLDRLNDRVLKKGLGLMFLGGEAAYRGIPQGSPLPDLLPVIPGPDIVDGVDPATGRAVKTFQTVPTSDGLDRSVMKVGKDREESIQLWDQVNVGRGGARLSGYNQFAPKPAARVYAWTSAADQPEKAGERPKGADPLLVGHQIGEANRGRVLAFGAFDTYLWQALGQPKTRQGVEVHNKFWRQCVLWLAHQEEEEGQVYARPKFRRLPVGGDQEIRVGLKTAAGADDPNAPLTVKVLAPGEDEAKAAPRQTVTDKDGARKVLFKPTAAGEYTVVVTSPVTGPDAQPVLDPDGKPAVLRGTARFLAYPEVSDEMILVRAYPELMRQIADASGGKGLRLEDLPGFLRELKGQPMDLLKPKPRFVPDWRRNHSKGFLPGWLVLFVALLGTEWGLRRFWGLV